MNRYTPVDVESMYTGNLSPIVKLGPIDDLEIALTDSWADVSRATYRFLTLLREFDLRRGWQAYGCNDCAEWLDLKLKMSRKTALEKVRVANALWLLPRIDRAYASGQLSYSQVRAVTRVANQDNEEDLLGYALQTTAAGLERHCQRLRNGDRVAAASDARRAHANRAVHIFTEGGSLDASLPPADLALVEQAIEKVAASLPEDPGRDYFATRADALVQMAKLILADEAPESRGADNYQVLVHVDAQALSGKGGECDEPLPTVQRLCCDGAVIPIVKHGNEVLDVGRKQRTVPTALKRALLARDRTCQFPGCHHRKFLDAHHIHHWADGGETSLDNLTLLCTHHHTLLHEGGFTLEKLRDGCFRFLRADGRPVETPMPSSAEDGLSCEEESASYCAVG